MIKIVSDWKHKVDELYHLLLWRPPVSENPSGFSCRQMGVFQVCGGILNLSTSPSLRFSLTSWFVVVCTARRNMEAEEASNLVQLLPRKRNLHSSADAPRMDGPDPPNPTPQNHNVDIGLDPIYPALGDDTNRLYA
jgi:hypothetical protein